jgi:aspartyl-tRNA(Asn)/glutamyl-tRNA(Gln) amidotransferase subunit A
MTRTVEDAALILKVLTGKDPYDATTVDIRVPDYLKSSKIKRKLIIGIADEYFDGVDMEINNQVHRCIDIIKKMGNKIKKIKLLHPKYSISVYTILQRAEVSSNLARYDGIRYGNGRYAFGQEAKKRIILGSYTLSHGYYDAYYKKAQKVQALIVEDFNRVFKEVDVIVSPTMPVGPLRIGESEKYPFFGEKMDVLHEPAALAGLPAINLPVGLDSMKLPMGMQVIGRHFDEETILNLAYQFEKETEFFGVKKVLPVWED